LASKKYKPKVTQINNKVLGEESTPKNNIKQTPSAEASTNQSEVRRENLEEVVPKIKIESDPSDSPDSPNKISPYIPTIVTFLSTQSSPEAKVSVL
jgi:hypothetical protein